MVRNPLVVILGATGTGKTKLAVEIAKKFGGEVISADSMQVYKGLDIITNKVTEEEAGGIRHHMLDILEPPARFSVVDFRNKSLPIIKDLHSKGILPVVVGGTNYYIESLVWKVLVESEDEGGFDAQDDEDQDLIFNRYPYEETAKVACSLMRTTYLLEFVEFSERVFLAYLQFRIDSMPRFHDVIGDLLDSPANFSGPLLIHKATGVLDEIADYELGSIMMCTRYRWIMNDFRNVEKILLDFTNTLYTLIRESFDRRKAGDGRCSNPDDECSELEQELNCTFLKLHKGPCLENIEFSVSDYPIPAEYALLSLRMDELKRNNCYTEIKRAMELIGRVVTNLDYRSLVKMSNDLHALGRLAHELLLPRLLKIVVAESLEVDPIPSNIPSDENPEHLHGLLTRLDPEMASTLHPNDTRKVLRSLQVCFQKGRKHSEILAEQRQTIGGSSLGGPLRFENTVIIWLQCKQDVLEKRLDERVDDMMSRGLLKELSSFYNLYNDHIDDNAALEKENIDTRPVYTQGIFQSIGFKEFDSYLKLSEIEKTAANESGRRALDEGLAGLRLATKRYAKRQNKWVNQRFINTSDRHVPPVYGIDTSSADLWESQVHLPASAVVAKLLGLSSEGCTVPSPVPRPKQSSTSSTIDNKSNHYCDTCDRVFIGDVQWNAHIKSKKHQKVSRKKQQQRTLSNKKEKLDSNSDVASTS